MIQARSPVLISLLSFLLVGVLLTDVIEARGGGGPVSVRGYFRKDGTYVQPHLRTAPDANPYNNYSFPGNYNPNTGQITGGDPDKYLERYYQRQGESSATSGAPPVMTVPPTTPSVPTSRTVITPAPGPATNLAGFPTPFKESVNALSAKSSNFIKTLQQELKEAGFDPGSANGQMEIATERALKRFQEIHGLSASGELDIATLTKLVERNLQR